MNIDGKNIKELISGDLGSLNIDDRWLYFTINKPDYKNEIYKMKKDGSYKVKISDIDGNNLNIIDGWIYCNGNRELDFYKISTDGTGRYKKLR